MSGPIRRQGLAGEPDFRLAGLTVRPSLCRIVSHEGEIRVEALTMSLLVALTRNVGATVTREQLVRDCWQGRFVSDDAIARAISKIRALARRLTPAPFLLETVPKVGYRLVPAEASAVAVSGPVADIEQASAPALVSLSSPGLSSVPAAAPPSSPIAYARKWLPVALVAGVAAVAVLGVTVLRGGQSAPSPPMAVMPEGNIHAPDFVDAMMNLDEPRLHFYLEHGWKPSWHLDSEGSSALTYLMLVCERNRTHDQDRLKRVAQLLVAAGADPGYRNKWGDSALIIARSPKYCGPDHPVVPYLQSIAPASGDYLADRN